MKKIVFVILVLLLSISIFGCSNGSNNSPVKEQPKQTDAVDKQADENVKADVVVYKNTQYGFNFTLPASWKGYTIVNDKWEGLTSDDAQKVAETGPEISIRHPLWTTQNPRQDIPIMIFTLAQWESLQQEKFHIGAAPIEPSEIARNSKYVFALPARYNFAFPTGYEEVEKILADSPLQPIEK